MKLRFNWEVLYQEIDSDRRMRLFTLENHVLTVAGKAADDGGYGIQYLYPLGLTWIITNCSIEMQELPKAGDHLVFETWIESNAHMLSVRNFRIYKLKDSPLSTEGRNETASLNFKLSTLNSSLLGRAKTTWAVLDLKKREIVNVFDHPVFQNIVDGEVLDMPKMGRMLPINSPLSTKGRNETASLNSQLSTINYSMIDYNNHLNSCKYPELMLDVYKPDWFNEPFRFDIRYVKEMHLGQTIETMAQIEENKVRFQQKDETGAIVCSAKIEKLQKNEV